MKARNGITNEKIEAFLRRQAALKAGLEAALVQEQKARAKLAAREFSAVGEALVKFSAQSPQFRSTLNEMLAAASAGIDESSRRYLAGRGWRL